MAPLAVLEEHADTVNFVRFFAFPGGLQSAIRPGLRYGSLLVSGGKDGAILLWDIQWEPSGS